MSSVDSSSPRRGFRLRFSLLALLVFMTAACLVLAWVARPRKCSVEAQFLVTARPVVLLGDDPDFDAEEYRLLRESQRELLRSQVVIDAAIRDPAIAVLPLVANSRKPVQEIFDRLQVHFRNESELLTIRMSGPESEANDLRQLVDAIAQAYLAQVANDHDQRHRHRSDALRRAYMEIQRRITSLQRGLQESRRELNVDSDYAGDKFGLKELQSKIDQLNQLLPEIQRQLEILEINAMAPPRVRLVQPAMVTIE